MTKIIISLFLIVLTLHAVAALTTYVSISLGRFVEGNPTTAELQFSYGLTNGLMLTLIQGTVLSIIPLITYLGTVKFAQSNSIQPSEKESVMRLVKYFCFPLALSVLVYLTLIAGADVTHDLAMILSDGKINLWSF
jgi:hypothetical protein